MYEQFDRITHNPNVMGGKACIRGMRVTVGMILTLISEGKPIDELLDDFPYLDREDVMQALVLCKVKFCNKTRDRKILCMINHC